MLTTMNMTNTIAMCALGGWIGCDGDTPKWRALTFMSSISVHKDTGLETVPEPEQTSFLRIRSPHMDDGFGSALAFGDDHVWIGAPHGPEGVVYQWDGSTLKTALSKPGRLGSHLSWSVNGLWAAAPLYDSGIGAIFLMDGTRLLSTHPNTGIALTSSGGGAYAWANGWTNSEGASENVIGRPTSLHVDAAGATGIGMAHGPFAFQSGTFSFARQLPTDEAGFALSAGDVDSDGEPNWIIGAPGANAVFAISTTAPETPLQRWTGDGRFGHAVAVCPDPTGSTHLLIGAPLDPPAGKVFVFTNYSTTPTATWLGSEDSSEFGTSLACTPNGFLAGAPGDATRRGMVLRVRGFIPDDDAGR